MRNGGHLVQREMSLSNPHYKDKTLVRPPYEENPHNLKNVHIEKAFWFLGFTDVYNHNGHIVPENNGTRFLSCWIITDVTLDQSQDKSVCKLHIGRHEKNILYSTTSACWLLGCQRWIYSQQNRRQLCTTFLSLNTGPHGVKNGQS